MLVSGTHICIRRDGATKPVEDLQIGELIFDPLNGGYNEIIDILTRRLVFKSQRELMESSLCPVVIEPGQTVANSKSKRTLVSPQQQVLVRGAGDAFHSLHAVPAKDVGSSCAEPLSEITYHAVFLERCRPLWANGLLCSSLDSAVFRSQPSLQVSETKIASLMAAY